MDKDIKIDILRKFNNLSPDNKASVCAGYAIGKAENTINSSEQDKKQGD